MTNSEFDQSGKNMIFIFCPPRSGSTMLQMMLNSHSKIASLPEPFVLPPLHYLGYYAPVSGAVFDAVNQSKGFQEFIDSLPSGEDALIRACRRYANTLYGEARQATKNNAVFFLDKTPANVLTWELITRIYPEAKYIVLTRHPYAVADSYARSFFLGDYKRMHNADLSFLGSIRAIAAFMRQSTVPFHKVCYESLVHDPDKNVRELLDFLELPFEQNVIDYGNSEHRKGTLGDPITAGHESRPKESYAWQWVDHFRENAEKVTQVEVILESLTDEDLACYGYPRQTLKLPLQGSKASSGNAEERVKKGVRMYHVKRYIFFKLKTLTKAAWVRAFLKSVRYYCDVLLR